MIVTAEFVQQPPEIPPRNSTGMNTAASESVIERIVNPISFDAVSALLPTTPSPMFHVAHDVFQHHDGVVHHESDRERQRHQRKVVDRVIQHVHDSKCPDDRHRQREARNHRR